MLIKIDFHMLLRAEASECWSPAVSRHCSIATGSAYIVSNADGDRPDAYQQFFGGWRQYRVLFDRTVSGPRIDDGGRPVYRSHAAAMWRRRPLASSPSSIASESRPTTFVRSSARSSVRTQVDGVAYRVHDIATGGMCGSRPVLWQATSTRQPTIRWRGGIIRVTHITPTMSVGVGRIFESVRLFVCLFVSPEHISKTNDPKVFKLDIGNDLGTSYK